MRQLLCLQLLTLTETSSLKQRPAKAAAFHSFSQWTEVVFFQPWCSSCIYTFVIFNLFFYSVLQNTLMLLCNFTNVLCCRVQEPPCSTCAAASQGESFQRDVYVNLRNKRLTHAVSVCYNIICRHQHEIVCLTQRGTPFFLPTFNSAQMLLFPYFGLKFQFPLGEKLRSYESQIL